MITEARCKKCNSIIDLSSEREKIREEAEKEFLDKLNKFIELHWICFGDDYGYIKSKFDEFKEELELQK